MVSSKLRLPRYLPEPPQDGDDELAAREGSAIANLDDLSKLADHTRSEKLKDHFIFAVIGIFWLLIILFTVVLLLLTWHLLSPPRWQWLDRDTVSHLEAVMGGAALSGIAQFIAKKYLQ